MPKSLAKIAVWELVALSTQTKPAILLQGISATSAAGILFTINTTGDEISVSFGSR